MPRPSALARRYNVRPSQVEQAVRELAARHLIRQLPDGQLYRASPAEYLIPVHGSAAPRCARRPDGQRRQLPQAARSPGAECPRTSAGRSASPPPIRSASIKCHWSVNGEPAAISTTYLTAEAAGQVGEPAEDKERLTSEYELCGFALADGQRRDSARARRAGRAAPGDAAAAVVGRPGTAARAGQPAAMITVRFDDQVTGRAVALTVAALRADMFRIVVDSPGDTAPVRNITPRHALPDEIVAATAGEEEGFAAGGQAAIR